MNLWCVFMVQNDAGSNQFKNVVRRITPLDSIYLYFHRNYIVNADVISLLLTRYVLDASSESSLHYRTPLNIFYCNVCG